MKKQLLIILAIGFVLVGCEKVQPEVKTVDAKPVVKTNMPPTYRLVCNNSGRYGVGFTDTSFVIGEDFQNKPITSKQQAILVAWEFYMFEIDQDRKLKTKSAVPKINWQQCE